MTCSGSVRDQLAALVAQKGNRLMDPPVLLQASDYFDLAGEEFGRRLLLTEGADGRQYCLRPDFTLPIARHHLSLTDPDPASYSYLGTVFRQRTDGPVEFAQAGLELLGYSNSRTALDRVFAFVHDAMDICQVSAPHVRLGSIELFEQLLADLDMPQVWRPRLQRRFGNKNAMAALVQRLAESDPVGDNEPEDRQTLIGRIAGHMRADGVSLTMGRSPEEIADRYLEKQALSRARIPEKSLEVLGTYLEISGPMEAAIDRVRRLSGTGLSRLGAALERLEQHGERLGAQLPGATVNFEAGFSPQLHYYTGLVFELRGAGDEVLASGGQYDRLMQALGAQNRMPAAGCALWVDRLQQEAGP